MALRKAATAFQVLPTETPVRIRFEHLFRGHSVKVNRGGCQEATKSAKGAFWVCEHAAERVTWEL
jgi:hypothetical protein